MSKISTKSHKNHTTYLLTNRDGSSWMEIIPSLGGMVTKLGFNNKELLFLDEQTLWDSFKPAKGGIPVLFPICGYLDDQTFVYSGKEYKMNIHGFARDQAWNVVDLQTTDALSITIELKETQNTLEQYPFRFHLSYTFELKESCLLITQQFKNNSLSTMPFYAGFHPYFKADNKVLNIRSKDKLVLDRNTNQFNTINNIVDLRDKKKPLVLFHKDEYQVSFFAEETNKHIYIKCSDPYKYTAFWTEQERKFVCLEPWMGLPNDLNTTKNIPSLAPNDHMTTYVEIGYL